jgi:hypothetical protein
MVGARLLEHQRAGTIALEGDQPAADRLVAALPELRSVVGRPALCQQPEDMLALVLRGVSAVHPVADLPRPTQQRDSELAMSAMPPLLLPIQLSQEAYPTSG